MYISPLLGFTFYYIILLFIYENQLMCEIIKEPFILIYIIYFNTF